MAAMDTRTMNRRRDIGVVARVAHAGGCLRCYVRTAEHEVSETRGSSGLSQHMWFNEFCIQHQVWNHGGYTWHQAGLRAAAVKAMRENESFHEKGPMSPEVAVVPARSAAHRMALQEENSAAAVYATGMSTGDAPVSPGIGFVDGDAITYPHAATGCAR